MNIEEAIKILESGSEMTDYPHTSEMLDEACDMAVAALRAQAEAEQNVPLTLDELREMDGEPVWIVFNPDAYGDSLAMWALVSVDEENGEIFLMNSIGGSSAYEEVWADVKAVYRRKPECERRTR